MSAGMLGSTPRALALIQPVRTGWTAAVHDRPAGAAGAAVARGRWAPRRPPGDVVEILGVGRFAPPAEAGPCCGLRQETVGSPLVNHFPSGAVCAGPSAGPPWEMTVPDESHCCGRRRHCSTPPWLFAQTRAAPAEAAAYAEPIPVSPRFVGVFQGRPEVVQQGGATPPNVGPPVAGRNRRPPASFLWSTLYARRRESLDPESGLDASPSRRPRKRASSKRTRRSFGSVALLLGASGRHAASRAGAGPTAPTT